MQERSINSAFSPPWFIPPLYCSYENLGNGVVGCVDSECCQTHRVQSLPAVRLVARAVGLCIGRKVFLRNITGKEVTRIWRKLPSRSESSMADRELGSRSSLGTVSDKSQTFTFGSDQEIRVSPFPECSFPYRSKERAPSFVPLIPVFLRLRTNRSGRCPLGIVADHIQTKFPLQCRLSCRRSHPQIPPQTTQHSTFKLQVQSEVNHAPRRV